MKKLLALLTVTLSVACASGGGDQGEGIADFSATLRANQGFSVNGTADAVASIGRTLVTVNITGATPGARHPWHVHAGSCGSNGPIVGSASDYPVIEVDSDGRERVVATLSLQLDEDDDYYVNVHQSPEQLGVIVACGELVD